MPRLRLRNINDLLAASALILAAASSGLTAQSAPVQLPTGWKTPSELYAMLAKLPADKLEQVLYEGAKKEGAIAYASPAERTRSQSCWKAS